MNKTDIDKLEAGPELDARVAERVMGWFKVRWREKPRRSEWVWRWCRTKATYYAAHGSWSPSTDWAAAGEVLEKLNLLTFSLHRENCGGVRYDVVCYDKPDQSDQVHATATAAPLAICRAALKAVEESE